MMLKHYALFTALALCAGAVAGGAVHKLAPAKQQVITVSSAKPTQTAIARAAVDQWPEIEQLEVDKLTAALKAVPASQRRPVVIFCQIDTRCGDLALNLENAFESAHWTVDREVPLYVDTVGLGSNDTAMAALLARSTTLPEVKQVDARLPDKIAIVIGKRPRGG